ncbi:nagb/rpia/CoA transferase-like protein [Xylariaceae sp. FL0255]|nr:nagb/rpia/CoA transferase-like protein [Xylariaceae sp. FL0255]
MNSAALQAAKARLRILMKDRLSRLSPESVTAQSETLFKTLLNFKPYQDAKALGVFLSMPRCEIQTDAIVRHALAAGKHVFVPYLHRSRLPKGEGPARIMDMVKVRDVHDYESLRHDKWGIPSVDESTVDQRQRSVGEIDGDSSADMPLDLIFLPGVAFDLDPKTREVRRLGHGKGFYDYFLHRYSLIASTEVERASQDGHAPVLLYALALKEQFIPPALGEAVPVGPHDQPIHGIILGDGQIKESASSDRD